MAKDIDHHVPKAQIAVKNALIVYKFGTCRKFNAEYTLYISKKLTPRDIVQDAHQMF